MKRKVVFVSQGPELESSPIPFYLLKHYALTDPRLDETCELVHQPLIQFDAPSERDRDEACYGAAENILAESPSLVALSLYCWNAANLLKTAAYCKQLDPAVTIVAGGPDTLGVGETLLATNPVLDAVISAPEGELPFQRFLQHLFLGEGNREQVPFIRFRDGARVVCGTETVFVPDLDEIPSAILPYSAEQLEVRLGSDETRSVIMETSRSCPVHCAFCQYPKMERSMRYFSLPRVFRELEHLRRIGVKTIYFSDGIFTLRKERAGKILQYFAETFTDCVIHCEVKLDILPESLIEVCRRLNDEGRLSFGIGIQSTNKRTLRTMGRSCDFDKLERKARAVFVKSTARWDLIYGLPGDVFSDLLDGMDYIFSLMPGSIVAVQPLLALPGTEYRGSAGKYGLVYDPSPPYPVIRSNTFTPADMKKARLLGEVYGAFVSFFRFLYRSHGEHLRTLFREVFDPSYFGYTEERGWDDRPANLHHFAARVRDHVHGIPHLDDRQRRIVDEAMDWEYLVVVSEHRGVPAELLDLPTRVSGPDANADGVAGRFVIPTVLDAAHIYRFEHLRKVDGRYAISASPPDDETVPPQYVVLADGRKVVLSEHGFQLLSTFREPRTVEQGLERLREQSEAWLQATPEQVEKMVSRYVRMGYLGSGG